MLPHSLTFVCRIVMIGLSIEALAGGLAWGADATETAAKVDSASEYLPFIIGGTVLFAIVGAGCLYQIGKRYANSASAAADAGAQTANPSMAASNPLAKLAVPLVLVIGVGVGIYFTFGSAAESLDSSSKAPPLAPTAPPLITTNFNPVEIQQVPVYTPSTIQIPPPAPPQIPQVIVPKTH
jgi:hypothetical protein